MTNTDTDKQIPEHDKDMTSELPESTKKKFITAYKHLEVAVDYFVKHVYSDPKNEEGKRQLNNIIEFFDIEYKRLLSQQREQAYTQGKEDVFELEKYNSYLEVNEQIRLCEGKHMQQVSFSTYHNALTQVCFDCKKIRTNIQLSKEQEK